MAARYTLEVNQLIGVELPWKIRKLNSLSRLSSARENLFPSSPFLLPLLTANDGNKNTFGLSGGRGGGRNKEEEEEEEGSGWIEDEGLRKDDCRRHPGVVWGTTTSEDGGRRSRGRRFEWCKRITAGQKQQIR